MLIGPADSDITIELVGIDGRRFAAPFALDKAQPGRLWSRGQRTGDRSCAVGPTLGTPHCSRDGLTRPPEYAHRALRARGRGGTPHPTHRYFRRRCGFVARCPVVPGSAPDDVHACTTTRSTTSWAPRRSARGTPRQSGRRVAVLRAVVGRGWGGCGVPALERCPAGVGAGRFLDRVRVVQPWSSLNQADRGDTSHLSPVLHRGGGASGDPRGNRGLDQPTPQLFSGWFGAGRCRGRGQQRGHTGRPYQSAAGAGPADPLADPHVRHARCRSDLVHRPAGVDRCHTPLVGQSRRLAMLVAVDVLRGL